MLKMKRARLLLFVMLLISIIGVSSYAATTLILGTQYEKQEMSEWCWAACSRMMGHSINNSTPPTQRMIVYDTIGSASNVPCPSTEDFEDAIEYACGGVNIYDYHMYYTFDRFTEILDKGAPITLSTYSHAYFLHGYDKFDEYLRIVDPKYGNSSWYVDDFCSHVYVLKTFTKGRFTR